MYTDLFLEPTMECQGQYIHEFCGKGVLREAQQQ